MRKVKEKKVIVLFQPEKISFVLASEHTVTRVTFCVYR